MTPLRPLSRSFGMLAALVLLLPAGCASADAESDELAGAEQAGASGGTSQADISDLYEDGAALGGEKKPPSSGQGGVAADPDSCLRIMSWGTVGRYGSVPGEDGQDAIVAWLNERSNAVAEHVIQPTAITPEFLAPFDIILLQNLNDWKFTHEEVLVFEKWVREGGGVFALAGYMSDGAAEVVPTNELLSFSGMKYNAQNTSGDTSTALGVCGYCLGTTYKQEGFSAEHPIAQGVTAVGAFQGRSIHGDGDVVASEGDLIFGMTKKIDAGRLFFFHDEWITYNNQWSSGTISGCEANNECSGMSPRETYQVAQLWYNSLRWLAPQASCFDLKDDSIQRGL